MDAQPPFLCNNAPSVVTNGFSYESFKYVMAPAWDHKPADVMSSRYTEDSLIGRLVVHNIRTEFRVYPSTAEFERHLTAMPVADRVYHEFIFGSCPQKLKFDIDGTRAKILEHLGAADNDEAVAAAYDNMIGEIIACLCNLFVMVFDMDDPRIVLFESRMPDGQVPKHSNHIIITNYYVNDHKQAREFTTRLLNYVPAQYREFIDRGVNGSKQNFRIAGCHKAEDMRIKTPLSHCTFAETLITDITGARPLKDITAEPQVAEKIILHEDDIAKVTKAVEECGIAAHHRFRTHRRGYFEYDRVRPSMCRICQTQHDSDNTLLITTWVSCGMVNVYEQCRRDKTRCVSEKTNPSRVLVAQFPAICDADAADIEVKRGNCPNNYIDRLINQCIDQPRAVDEGLKFDSLPEKNKYIYSSPTLHPFQTVRTLIVHAPMKMGKTKALREYINRRFNDPLARPVIRFLSFRQTFSDNIKACFPEFDLYKHTEGPLMQDRLILQIESLYRLVIQEGSEPPDLLILDECESIFEQFNSGLLKHFSDSFGKFRYLMSFSNEVICMDAGITNRTYNILNRMRPGGMLYHRNVYKNATEDKYYFTGDYQKWFGILVAAIESDQRIVIPTSSCNSATALQEYIMRHHPKVNVGIYSSKTEAALKARDFAAVNEYWAQFDVLIYTPTVSAGVSFEQRHFDLLMGYFVDSSCPVETCLQMMGRVRNIMDKTMYIVLHGFSGTLPCTPEAVSEAVHQSRGNLYGKYDHHGLMVDFDAHGKITYHTSDQWFIWTENTCIINMSKNSFIRRFISKVQATGAQCMVLDDQVFTNATGQTAREADGKMTPWLEDLHKKYKNAKQDVKAAECNVVAAAPDIGAEEVDDIRTEIDANRSITPQQAAAYDRYRLRRIYKYDGPIDVKFVETYREDRIKRIYRNLCDIHLRDDMDAALALIQEKERAMNHYYMTNGESTHHYDLRREYTFDRHRCAVGLIKLCGWIAVNDPQYIHRITLILNLRQGINVFEELARLGAKLFEFRAPPSHNLLLAEPDNMFIKTTLAAIGRIIGPMYGLRILARQTDPDMYKLIQTELFTLDQANKSVPCLIAQEERFTDEI